MKPYLLATRMLELLIFPWLVGGGGGGGETILRLAFKGALVFVLRIAWEPPCNAKNITYPEEIESTTTKHACACHRF